jgi:hypothetical protein
MHGHAGDAARADVAELPQAGPVRREHGGVREPEAPHERARLGRPRRARQHVGRPDDRGPLEVERKDVVDDDTRVAGQVAVHPVDALEVRAVLGQELTLALAPDDDGHELGRIHGRDAEAGRERPGGDGRRNRSPGSAATRKGDDPEPGQHREDRHQRDEKAGVL